jgi:hypothetical protein
MDTATRDRLLGHITAIQGHLDVLWAWMATQGREDADGETVKDALLTAVTAPLTALYTRFLWVNMWTIQVEPEQHKALILALARATQTVREALEAVWWAESLGLEELEYLAAMTKEMHDIHTEGQRVLGEAERIVRERRLREGRPETPPGWSPNVS